MRLGVLAVKNLMMEKKPLRRADFITSIILILSGIWIFIHTVTTFPMKDTYAGVQNVWYVSPALFPLLISTGIFILGIILLINSIKEGGAKTFLGGFAHFKLGMSENMLRFVSIVLLLVTLVYLNIPRIDFFLSTLICLTAFITMYYLDYGDILKQLTKFYAVGSLIFVLLFWLGVNSKLNRAVTESFIKRLTFSFQDGAFASEKAGNVEHSEYDLYLNFNDPTLFYADNRFKEADANDGSIDISKPITITVSGDTLAGKDGEDFVVSEKVKTNIDKVAPGLTPVITRVSSTELEVILTGHATKHLNADDVSDLTFTFQDTAFTSLKASTFANSQKQDLQINFNDPVMQYSTKVFKEASANHGAIDNSTPLTITLSGDTLTGEDGEDFVESGKAQTNIARMAKGLKLSAIRTSPSELQVTLTGKAEEHADADDTKELMLRFKDKAFTTAKANRVESSHKTDLQIDFNDSKLSFSKSGFREVPADDGSIDNSAPLTIAVSGDTLTGEDGEDFVTSGKVQTNIEQVASGLKAIVKRTSSSELQVMLTGTASSHADANDVDNLTFTFKDTTFASGNAGAVVDTVKNDLRIDFIELALTYSTDTFKEADVNDGSIENKEPVTITLTGDTLAGQDGEDFVTTGKVSTNIDEVAPGLTAHAIRTTPTSLEVTLAGNTVDHTSTNDVKDLTLRFQDEAFSSENAATVKNSAKNNLRITFSNPTLLYSKRMFKEANANDGSIDNRKPIMISLTGGMFTGSDGDDFVATGKVVTNLEDIAPGLTAIITRTSPTKLSVMLAGKATKHQRDNSTESLTFTFQDGAFASGNAANVTNFVTANLKLNLSNPVLLYSTKGFEEIGNDGSVGNGEPMTITLTGDMFTGEDGEDFVAAGRVHTNIDGVAPGLKAVMTRKSSTELEVMLTGKAQKHADADDVKKLAFLFQDSAFTSGNAGIVVNAAKGNLRINFTDLTLKYSKTGFKEAAANDGSIDNSKPLKVKLSGDKLTGEDGEDFVGAGKVSTNLDEIAQGLKAVVIRKSPTELEVTLEDAATQHTNENDVFIGGAFRFSMDILLFIFFLLYVWYCWVCVQKLEEQQEAKAKFLLALVVSIAVPVFIIPLFKYALLVPFPVEGGGIELMNLFWYSPAIRAIRKVAGRYLLLLGIDLIFVAIIVAIYFKFMRKAETSNA